MSSFTDFTANTSSANAFTTNSIEAVEYANGYEYTSDLTYEGLIDFVFTNIEGGSASNFDVLVG